MGVLGWDKLSTDNEERLADSVVRNAAVPFPVNVEIQPTNKCNIDCFFCSSKPFRNEEFLPWEKVEAILRNGAQAGLRSIRLSGGGEALIYPKLRQLLDVMEEEGLFLANVTTNATPLAPHAERIVRVGLDTISISLNEPLPDRYAETMRTQERRFHQAVEGTEALVAARDAAPPEKRPEIELKFMYFKGNFRHGMEMYELGRRLDVDKIMINQLWGQECDERMNDADREEARSILRDMIAADFESGSPRLHFSLDQEGLQEFAMSEVARHDARRFTREEDAQPAERGRIRYCMMGWYHLTVAATGLVYPCCNFVGLPGKDLGNLHEESIEEVWHGERAARYRREFRHNMLLRGRTEHSRKAHQYLEPYCIAENECPFSWGLANRDFYERVAEGMEKSASLGERLAAKGQDAALRGAHRVLSRK